VARGRYCRHGVGRVVPRPVEPKPNVGATRRNGPVVAQVVHGHIGAALRVAAVPETGDRLAVGERPSQRPTARRR